jgi:hypothetical protein
MIAALYRFGPKTEPFDVILHQKICSRAFNQKAKVSLLGMDAMNMQLDKPNKIQPLCCGLHQKHYFCTSISENHGKEKHRQDAGQYSGR